MIRQIQWELYQRLSSLANYDYSFLGRTAEWILAENDLYRTTAEAAEIHDQSQVEAFNKEFTEFREWRYSKILC